MALERLFPTNNDVGGSDKGRGMDEANITDWLRFMHIGSRQSFVVTGLVPTNASEAPFSVDLSAGSAYINGYRVNFDTVTNVPVNASETNQNWFLQLVRTAGEVTGHQFVRVLSADDFDLLPPTDSVLLFRCSTGVSTFSKLEDWRRHGNGLSRLHWVGNNTANRKISSGGINLRGIIVQGRSIGTPPNGVGFHFSMVMNLAGTPTSHGIMITDAGVSHHFINDNEHVPDLNFPPDALLGGTTGVIVSASTDSDPGLNDTDVDYSAIGFP